MPAPHLAPAQSTAPTCPHGTSYTVPVRFAPEYITYVLNENFEDAKRLFLSPLMAIHYAHLVMLADTRHHRPVRRAAAA